MEQPTFADLEYDGKKRKTRRERFLERMDGLIPWEAARGPHPTVLSEGGPRASSLRSVSDVAHSLCAVVLQSERPPRWRTCSTKSSRSDGSWA